ncbi:thioredoxin family protein [Ekhidna sp.]|uniref:TlpA family protein disulfide reductase n=1 Tax=Ekhidna sp. TaxID=2608089 RepID=UPI0032EEE38E
MRLFLSLLCFASWFFILAQDGQSQIPDEYYRSLLDHEMEDEFQKGIPVGEIFSDSTFITINGDEFSFVDSNYVLTVVDFWFKGCRGCAQEKPYIKQIIEKYKEDSRVRFVAITPTSENGIEKVIKKYGNYYDDIISVGGFKNCEELFKFSLFPRHVLVGNDGKVIANYITPIFHPITQDEYEKRILSFIDNTD